MTERHRSRREFLRIGAVSVGGVGAGCLDRTRTDSVTEPGSVEQMRPVDISEMELVFEDRFRKNAIDRSKWQTKYPWDGDARTHNHDAYAAEDNAFVSDRRLVLKAENQPRMGKPYTTGVVSAKKVFKPGYFEGVMKLPPVEPGFWPAFWLTSASYWPPEIDIFEVFGRDPKLYMTYHFMGDDEEPDRVRKTFSGPDFSAEYHTFAVDWSRERIVWYVDGVERFRYAGEYVSDEYMWLILNFGVGANFLAQPRPETFPATYEIERVQAWER
ncbi:glycoside hydrolase family 16 protein [Haloprofundus salilacus]|uniref:glycoside hydrolase family 16 protein n=1 Tax=Haloprofundus salilacus TaxID=2876190 RepID=UPI001CCD593A|nr:glycoside hydrolase family 16 protein [Haloprofundus salilacus]